jgi:diguanylate cyclase (GGDEF)-like protein/PAS domain S-box-containing protein
LGEVVVTDPARAAQRALDRYWLRAFAMVDRELVVQWVSPSFELLLGWSPDVAVGMSALEFIHPDDLPAIAAILAYETTVDPTFRTEVRQRTVKEIRACCPDGTHVAIEVSLTNFYDDPDIEMVLIDIAACTQFRFVDRALELSRVGADIADVLAMVLTQFTSPDPAQPAAVIFDHEGVVLAATANAPEPYGRSAPEVFRVTWHTPLITSANVDPVGLARFWSPLDPAHPMDVETSDRVARHAAVTIGQHRTNVELRRAALHDPLTGIGNRRSLEQDLQARLDNRDLVVLVYLDLDQFKAINDDFGHAAGDHVLKIVADRLSTSLRSGDRAARIGGDEFVVLLGPPAPNPETIRQRLADIIAEPIAFGGHIIRVSASIGFGEGQADADTLLRIADSAMLERKRQR